MLRHSTPQALILTPICYPYHVEMFLFRYQSGRTLAIMSDIEHF
jgi:hypothetical protein